MHKCLSTGVELKASKSDFKTTDLLIKPFASLPLKPPVAKQIPHTTVVHDRTLIDNYFWLREKSNPEVVALLEAENAYTEAMLASGSDLRQPLFEEMKARIEEDDQSVPYRIDDYFYYNRMIPGKQYALHCRKRSSLEAPEEILLDENQLAEGKEYFSLGIFEVSPDHRSLAYAIDLDGSEKYTIHFKDLITSAHSRESISLAAHSLEWSEDSSHVFYTMLDANERPDRLLRHRVGTAVSEDVLVYQEADPQLFVFCGKSRSREFIFIQLSGKVTSEVHFLDAKNPLGNFRVISPRRRGVLYSVAHWEDRFFIVTNDLVQNFRLVQAPVSDPGPDQWKELRTGSPTLFIESAEAFKDHLILRERERGLPQLRVVDLKTSKEHVIEFPEPTYYIGGEANPEFNTHIFRFSYTSLVTPHTVYDYNLHTGEREIKKRQNIPSGYDSSQYRSEWLMTPTNDGTLVPVSVVYKLDSSGGFKRDGSRPLYLYGYGSYGLSMYASFSTTRLSLLDRGFVFAIAHVRGGSELGRQWYEDGKFLKKMNTFTDFINCAEHLIALGFTREGEIVMSGGSAGGMLVGAAVNLKPSLFKAAVAKVPFVDVVNTMLDATLPLTTLEYDEWGHPENKEYFEYIHSYSPYDNVKPQAYPHMLITSGFHDPRVTYWEPAKWVAKLRELNLGNSWVLQHINMQAGHGGASGRYEYLKEVALEYAFILRVFAQKTIADSLGLQAKN